MTAMPMLLMRAITRSIADAHAQRDIGDQGAGQVL
jgi:hypothetical protein